MRRGKEGNWEGKGIRGIRCGARRPAGAPHDGPEYRPKLKQGSSRV